MHWCELKVRRYVCCIGFTTLSELETLVAHIERNRFHLRLHVRRKIVENAQLQSHWPNSRNRNETEWQLEPLLLMQQRHWCCYICYCIALVREGHLHWDCLSVTHCFVFVCVCVLLWVPVTRHIFAVAHFECSLCSRIAYMDGVQCSPSTTASIRETWIHGQICPDTFPMHTLSQFGRPNRALTENLRIDWRLWFEVESPRRIHEWAREMHLLFVRSICS